MSLFYSHLIEIESIIVELDQMGLSSREKTRLAAILDDSLHHTILDAIFTQLSDEDKKVFVMHLSKGSHDKIWDFLNKKIDHVEDKIKAVAEELKKELHKDILEARKRRSSVEATKKTND